MAAETEEKRRIRVLQVANSLEIGGLEKVVLNILNVQLPDQLCEIGVACLEDEGALDDFVREGIAHIHLHKTHITRSRLIRNLANIVRKEKIDIIHCHNYAPLLFSVLVKILLLGRVKIVYTEHNQIYSISSKHYRIFRYLLKFADEIVTVSEDLQKYFLKEKLGKKSTVIWNGIPEPQVNKDEVQRLSALYRKNENDFLVGTAVVMSEQKGLKFLVEAAGKVVREVPQIKFLLIGDGPLRKELEQQVAENGLSENIIFPGYQKEVHNHLKTLDVFVLSSLWEGFSIALIEALALELPIVATDVGGNGEIVNNMVTGMLVPAKDPQALKKALLTLYDDQNLRQTFAQNGRKHFDENCTVLTMVEKYHRLYKRLMNIR